MPAAPDNNMRRSLPASAAIHGLLLAGAFWLLHGNDPDNDVRLESLAVSIVSTQTASDNISDVESDATQTLVAAGAPATPIAEPVPPEAVPETKAPSVNTASPSLRIEAVRPAGGAVEPLHSPTLEPVATPSRPIETSAEILAAAADPAMPLSTVPPEEQTLEEPEAADIVQPVEATTPVERPVVKPSAKAPAHIATPAPRPRQQPAKREAQKPHPSASSGAGGAARANAEAAPASRGGLGRVDDQGSAADTRYPGLVLAKLRSALRRPANGGHGEVEIGFTVLADGRVSGVRVVSSSGSPALDQAALDTIARATPFPPIPAAAQRASWKFVMPLNFRR